MGRKLLTLLLLFSSASNAIALKCHVCQANGVCDGDEIGDLQVCPSIAGYVADQCVKFDGGISGSIAGTAITFNGVIRSCNLIPQNLDAPPLKCVSGSNATTYFRNVVGDLVPDATSIGDVLDVAITGDLCYCADDGCNGVDSLKPFLWLIFTVRLMYLLLM